MTTSSFWPGRLYSGFVTLLAALEPHTARVLAADLIARGSDEDASMPGVPKTQITAGFTSLVVTSEPVAFTSALKAAGADMTCVNVVDSTLRSPGAPRSQWLTNVLQAVPADVVVFDCLMGATRTARIVLKEVRAIAANRCVGMLGLTQLKRRDFRVIGDAADQVAVVMAAPQDPTRVDGSLLGVVRTNADRHPDPIRFRLTDDGVRWEWF